MPRISLVDAAQQAVARHLKDGDIAIDATAGNGHDTVFLARQVGATGLVYAFDIQPAALAATAERLQREGLAGHVRLCQQGHERMQEAIPAQHHGNIQALMFNLGYLPGGDRTVLTRAATSLRALDAAMQLLAPGGVLTVLAYPGHPGGSDETAQVAAWCARHGNPVPLQAAATRKPSPLLWVIRMT